MMGFFVTLHMIICILLIGIILIQAGRGGGLVENFSSVESMFGTKTNIFMTRTTTVLAVLFFLNCIGLAFLSAQQSKSLMRKVKAIETKTETQKPANSGVMPLQPLKATTDVNTRVNAKESPAVETNKAQVQTEQPAQAAQAE